MQYRGFVLSVVFSCLALAGGPRQTTDKQPLPDAGARALSVKLPILGLKLGALPEEACPRVWEIDSELQYVADSRHQMGDDGIDLDGYNYMGEGVGGAIRTALCVENGRVKKIILFHPGWADDVANQMMAKIASDSQSKPVGTHDGYARFKVHDIAFLIRKVGKWDQFVESTKGVFMGQQTGRAAHTNSGPAGIEICVDEVDWQIVNVSKDPAVIKAMQKGKLLKGMTEVEAYLAMRAHKLYRKHNGDTDTWAWTDKENVERDTMVTSDSLGVSTTTWYSHQEKIIATAVFKDGVLDTFEDETMLSTPPKGN